MAEIADVVILSYNYLVDPNYIESIENLVSGNFIVFDEAHNICNVLESANSWILNFDDFNKILFDIDIIINIC